MKEENKLTKKESSILSLQELDITGPNQDQWTAGLVAPIVFTSVETFGLGSAHLLSGQPKVAFHLASMLSTWFRIYTGEAYACPCCPRRCWHRETWRLLIEACIYRLSSFLFSPSYCDSGRQATLARTVWHRRTGTFFLPWFIKSFFLGGGGAGRMIHLARHMGTHGTDITSSDHLGQIYCLPKWQPKYFEYLKIFNYRKLNHCRIQGVDRQITIHLLIDDH